MTDPTEQDIREHLDARRYREAFELLVDRYQSKVYRLCCALLGNDAAAEDAAQDAFLRVWRGLAGYRGEAAVSTWLYTVTRNTCLTKSRREAARTTEPLGEVAAEERPDAGSERLDLRALISRLPEKHRQALMLFYYEDRSYEEVAVMLDLPLGTVKTHLHRARKALADALAPQKTEASHDTRRA